MDIRNLPTTSGIYQFLNTINGKSYVGSAVNMRRRASDHLVDLRKGTHYNLKLQRAWNKYGAEAFVARVLELVPNKVDLVSREQYWMDVLQPVKNGYNTAPRAYSGLGLRYRCDKLAGTYEGLIDPEGNPVEPITNLEQFSKERGLDPSSMNKVYRGAMASYRGWTHVNSVNKRNAPKHWQEYPGWISPEGEEVTIVNLRQFCKEHNLDQPSMWKVMQGKYPQHKGWRYPAGGYTRKQRQTDTWYGYVSPEGKQVVITHLTNFCRANGLNEGHMVALRKGGVRKSHKGWTYNPALEKEGE